MQFGYFFPFCQTPKGICENDLKQMKIKMLKPRNMECRTSSQTTVESRTICEGPVDPERGPLLSYHRLHILWFQKSFMVFLFATCQRWIPGDKSSTELDINYMTKMSLLKKLTKQQLFFKGRFWLLQKCSKISSMNYFRDIFFYISISPWLVMYESLNVT